MSIFGPGGLAISLPGAELGSLELPGSVSEPEAVLAGRLSADLRTALLLILRAYYPSRVPVRVVARPEIFTHGDAERWLRARLDNVTQHLCISDGTTIKLLPGCQTHVFFYRLATYRNYTALQRLSARAPELVARVESQVNTALPLGMGVNRFVPEPIYLTHAATFPRPVARLMPFFFNKHSAEDTANRIEHRGEVTLEQVPEYEDLIYLPLTETALHDADFARAVAETVVQAFFRPESLLVLRLPSVEDESNALTAQIHAVLPRLRDTGVTIPRCCPPNVLLATSDLAEDSALFEASPWTMMFHESFDFWRHTEAYYRRADRVVVMAGQGDHTPVGFLPLNVAPLFGPRAIRTWLRGPALS